MRVSVLILAALACATPSHLAADPTIRPDHPYLGRWTWVYEGCTELYTNRADGTTSVVSGEEVGEGTFTITDETEDSGFYRVVDTVTTSNGKTGCDGQEGGTPVGSVATIFVFIRPSGDEMLECKTPSLDRCTGPLKRIPPEPVSDREPLSRPPAPASDPAGTPTSAAGR